MIRTLAAEIRIGVGTDARGEPNAPAVIHHRIMGDALAVPNHLIAPIGRGLEDRIVRRCRDVRVVEWNLDIGRFMRHGIQHRKAIGAEFRRPIELAISVDRRIAAVGCDFVMHVELRLRPIPLRDDYIALNTLGAFRRVERQLACSNPVCPIGIFLQCSRGAEAGNTGDHGSACLAGLNAPRPRVFGALEIAKFGKQRSRRLIAKLVTGVAAR